MWNTITYPWEAISIDFQSDFAPDEDDISWCPQIVASEESVLTSATSGGLFPTRVLSGTHKILELPGPAIKGDMSRQIILDIDRRQQVTFQYLNGSNKQDHSERIEQFELFFDQIMNAMLFLMRDCIHVDQHKTRNIYWDDILEKVHKNEDNDPAKYALVVDLARLPELINPVDRITEKPKRVLRRIHDQERIQKVKEIDIKCIIDLARRPGSVLAEKAGPKQRILAIKRTENIDILENRVTKHCCSLAVTASKRYLREHDHIKIDESPRKKMVKKLFLESKKLPLKSTFQDIVNLIEPCRQPNYTLMQNADYYKVWKAYAQLVRNEDLRAELWKWNRRMWVEYVALFLVDILHAFQKIMTDENLVEIGQKTVFGNRRHASGSWFLSDALPGPFLVDPGSNSPGTLYFIQGDHDSLINLSETLADLSALNADYLLICFRDNQKTVLPIYGILPSHHLTKNDRTRYVNDMLPSLMKNIRSFNTMSTGWTCKNGWVLFGNWSQNKTADKVQNLKKGMKCWTSEVNPDYRDWEGNREKYFEPLMNICGS